MGAAIALAATLGVGAATIALGYNIFNSIAPSRRKIEKDLKELREELAKLVVELVPLTKKELELLCSRQNNSSIKKRVVTTWKGVFSSIYHEDMIVYAYRKYMGKKANSVILAKTANHEFIYRIKDTDAELMIDTHFVGVIRENGVLYPPKSKKGVAKIAREASGAIMPVFIGDKEVASIYREGALKQPNPRAFEFVVDMPKQEELVFLALAIYELIGRNAVQKK